MSIVDIISIFDQLLGYVFKVDNFRKRFIQIHHDQNIYNYVFDNKVRFHIKRYNSNDENGPPKSE